MLKGQRHEDRHEDRHGSRHGERKNIRNRWKLQVASYVSISSLSLPTSQRQQSTAHTPSCRLARDRRCTSAASAWLSSRLSSTAASCTRSLSFKTKVSQGRRVATCSSGRRFWRCAPPVSLARGGGAREPRDQRAQRARGARGVTRGRLAYLIEWPALWPPAARAQMSKPFVARRWSVSLPFWRGCG